jgi:hypothetical protein
MDLRKDGCFTSAHCRHNHQSWSCEQQALQVLTVATSINHGVAKRYMTYKCSLSHQASIMELRKTGCFSSADCSNKQLEALHVVRVGVGIGVGVAKHKMFNHCSLSQQDASQVLTFATGINHGSAKNWMLY